MIANDTFTARSIITGRINYDPVLTHSTQYDQEGGNTADNTSADCLACINALKDGITGARPMSA